MAVATKTTHSAVKIYSSPPRADRERGMFAQLEVTTRVHMVIYRVYAAMLPTDGIVIHGFPTGCIIGVTHFPLAQIWLNFACCKRLALHLSLFGDGLRCVKIVAIAFGRGLNYFALIRIAHLFEMSLSAFAHAQISHIQIASGHGSAGRETHAILCTPLSTTGIRS